MYSSTSRLINPSRSLRYIDFPSSFILLSIAKQILEKFLINCQCKNKHQPIMSLIKTTFLCLCYRGISTYSQKPTTKTTTGATTTAQLLTTPLSPHSGKPWRGAALTYPNAPYFVVGGGIPIRIHKLTPYGAEMRDKSSYVLLTIHWIFDTTIAEYEKGRTFAGSSRQSHFSEGKENREEGGHQTT
jgi:hypothetical protein